MSKGRSLRGRSSMRWRPAIPCCAARSAIMTLFSVVRFYASSPVSRTFLTNRPTSRCPSRSRPGKSRLSSSVRLQEAEQGSLLSYEHHRSLFDGKDSLIKTTYGAVLRDRQDRTTQREQARERKGTVLYRMRCGIGPK